MNYLRLSAAAALLVGVLLIFVLFWQFAEVYFVFGGQTATPTHAEATRFVWTGSLCVASMVAALALATVASSRGTIVCGIVGLVLAGVAVVLFAVPQDRWKPQPPAHELPENYQPCYSGSNDCVGG